MSTTPDKHIDNNIGLSKAEISTLAEFYETLKKHNLSFEILDGYYIGYSIKQISKEFDLLRFGDDSVINIELKSPLAENVKIKKITEQMHKNYYYLKFLEKEGYIYTHIENDGLYKYIRKNSIFSFSCKNIHRCKGQKHCEHQDCTQNFAEFFHWFSP